MDDGFPERLKKLRQQKKLLQADLAKMVDLHQNHIGRYERGTSKPSGEALKRLADALGVSVDYLLEGTPQDAARADFKDRELLYMFRAVEKLDDKDKAIVKALLDAFIKKQQIMAWATNASQTYSETPDRPEQREAL